MLDNRTGAGILNCAPTEGNKDAESWLGFARFIIHHKLESL